MRPEVRARHAEALTRIDGDEAFLTRFERFFTDLHDPLHTIYGADPRFPAAWNALLDAIARNAAARDPELRRLDHEREITPDWLHREQTLSYVTYVDRFAGTLGGVRERLAYLRELGVTYLHLMPLLRTRPEPNDGGYAVTDYGEVEPALGTMDDLRDLAAELRAAGVALCVDVVLNHTAREHPWATAARGGGRSTSRSRTGRSPTPTSGRCPRSSRTPRRGTSRGTSSSAAGSGRRSTPTSGTSTTQTPRSSWPWRRPCWASRPPASTSCGWTRCRSCGSGWARTARTSPRSTTCC